MPITVSENTLCGPCGTNQHDRCVVGSKYDDSRGKHQKYPEGIVWACRCTDGGCTSGRRKCANCSNRVTEEINPETWECLDIEGCRDTMNKRREANPFYAQLREIKENVAMAKIAENKTKAEKAEKAPKEPTFCLVTGEPTKGGLFKPGMDARYVSERVADVTGKVRTEAQARKQMKDDGVSEALVAKFEKSLGLAREKAEKKAAADKAKAEAKAEAKKEKASA